MTPKPTTYQPKPGFYGEPCRENWRGWPAPPHRWIVAAYPTGRVMCDRCLKDMPGVRQ